MMDEGGCVQQLGTYVPSTAAFFLSYVSYRALTLLPMELCQLIPLLRAVGGDLLRCCCARPAPPEPPTIKAQPFGYTHVAGYPNPNLSPNPNT